MIGLNVGIEPAFRVTDMFTVGIKVEQSLEMISAEDYHELWVGFIASYSGNLRFYCKRNTPYRSYIGFGAGYYLIDFHSGSNSIQKFGFYPRFGIDTDHFNINIDFNIVGEVDHPSPQPSWETGLKNSNHITVRFGIMIGGGLKKPIKSLHRY